jgi:hypothetical protein
MSNITLKLVRQIEQIEVKLGTNIIAGAVGRLSKTLSGIIGLIPVRDFWSLAKSSHQSHRPKETQHAPEIVKLDIIVGLFQAYVEAPASCKANTSNVVAARISRPPT